MKGLWKSNADRRSQISATMKDIPKVCSYCGIVGHNRRGCPKLHPEKQHTEKVGSPCICLSVITYFLWKLPKSRFGCRVDVGSSSFRIR